MRTALLLFSAALLTYALFQGIRFMLLVRNGNALVKSSHAYERLTEGGSPRILVIGDSTGVGTGSEDSKLSVAGRFGTDFPKASIQNGSVNGWKVADALAAFPDVPAQSFDIVLLQIGANDIMRGTPLPEFSTTLDALFKKAAKAGKRVISLHSGNIGAAPLFPWPVSALMQSRTLAYRAEYQRLAAANGVTYVDLYREPAEDQFQGKAEFYASDKLHLSGKGYGVWYDAIRKAME